MAGAFVATMIACLALTAPAQAQYIPMMDFSTPDDIPPTPSITFTSNNGSGGTLVTNDGGTLIDIGNGPVGSSHTGDAYLTFGPISQIAGSGQQFGVVTVAQFGGGSFEVWTGANKTGEKLLAGTFGNSLFVASGTGNLFSLDFGTVDYDVTTDFAKEFLAVNPGTGIYGNFSLSLSSLSKFPIGVNGSGGLNSFNAKGFSGTMDAMAVPEPGEYAVMGMAGMTVCGLMVRARRRRNTGGTAS